MINDKGRYTEEVILVLHKKGEMMDNDSKGTTFHLHYFFSLNKKLC